MLLSSTPTKPLHLKSAISDENVFVQQKVDGQRVLVDCSAVGEVTFFNRKGDVIHMKGGYTSYFGKFRDRIFDGEYVDGVFWLFDCIEGTCFDMSFGDRQAVLQAEINETKTVRLLPTARSPEEKRDLIRAVIKSRGEGIVTKSIFGGYIQGERTNFAHKYKFYNDIDVVIQSVSAVKDSAEMIVYDDDENPVEIGSIKIGWGSPGDVLLVKYLYATEDNRLYQPSVIRRRKDKTAEECHLNQLRYTNRAVLDAQAIVNLNT